jgi:peptidyl-prolyl isomerase D
MCCLQVLELDASNTKALFRRGSAYLLMGDADAAEADLKSAQEKDPEDSAIKKELAKVLLMYC